MPDEDHVTVGKAINRKDGIAKVTGATVFGNDQNAYRQLHMKSVYTHYPHVEIESIDLSEAWKVPGVVDIIVARDIPGNPILFGRFPVLVSDRARYIGDAVAAIASESAESAEMAAAAVCIRYGKQFDVLTTVDQALAPDAPMIHHDTQGNRIDYASHHLHDGNAEAVIREAPKVIRHSYATQFVDNGYIEPEAVITEFDPNTDTVVIRGTIQNPYNIREALAKVLDRPLNQVRVIQSGIGGSFGGKDESMMFIASRAAVLSLRTGRPVKAVLTREESFMASAKRHPITSNYEAGLDENGRLLAIKSLHHMQGGAYNKQAMFANWRGSIHAAGPYAIPHVCTDIHGVHTNTIFGGAYRGFSAPQVVFGIESFIDECAEAVGMDPVRFRLLNCVKPYDRLPTGQVLDPAFMPANVADLIELVCSKTDFEKKWERNRIARTEVGSTSVVAGIGLSITFRGVGLGGEGIDTGSATVTIDADGKVRVQSGFTEMGQGLSTTLCQIAAEEFGIDSTWVTWSQNDTAENMDAGPTVASRGIVSGGNAVKDACGKLRKRIEEVLLPKWMAPEGSTLHFSDSAVYAMTPDKELLNRIGFAEAARICLKGEGISLRSLGWHSPGPQYFDHESGQGPAYPSYLFGATVAEVEVDQGTGVIVVKRITSAIELGKAINPQIVRGQFIGGAIQGMGYALMEEMDCSDGYLHTRNFDDFLMPGAMDIPPIDIIISETDVHVGPYGAKGIGELGIEMIAPAIANAHANATGKRIRELPLNLERVVLGHAL